MNEFEVGSVTIPITREYIIGQKVYDDMASAVGLFIAQCGEMAEKNWCPAQVEMLERLFGAVLKGCDYAEYEIAKGEENEAIEV